MADRIGNSRFWRFRPPTRVSVECQNQVSSSSMPTNSKRRHSEARRVPRNPSLSLHPNREGFLTSFGMTARGIIPALAPSAAIFLTFFAAATFLVLPVNTARAGTTTPIPQDEKPPAGNAQNGKKLYISYGCFECHGRQAEGTSVGGPRLGPKPISFPAFSKYVRQPTGQMPPFTAKVTSDADLADIFAFLQSLPQPPKADSIPALK
jgi:mono/diheme cytochrome c family protein